MNDSNCTLDENYKFIYLPVAYSISAFFGLLFNGFVFCRLVCRLRRRTKKLTPSSLLTANLAATDFLYAASLILLIHSYAARDKWVFGDFACRAVRFLFYFNLNVSVLFLAAISLYRYLGICHPMSTLRWQRRRAAGGVCAAVWAVAVAESAPVLYFSGEAPNRGQIECWDFKPDSSWQDRPYSVAVIFTGFAAPFVATIAFYSCIIRTLRKSPSLAAVRRRDARRADAIRTVAVVLVIFVVCHLPYNVSKMVFFFSGGNSLGCEADALVKTYKSLRGFVSLNCALNPVLFFVKRRRPGSRNRAGKRAVFVATISSSIKSAVPPLGRNSGVPTEHAAIRAQNASR